MSILLLPVELVAQILSHLPDVPSLSAAQRTSPYLYYAFRCFRVMILHQLSLRTVGDDLFPEAMAVLRAQRHAVNDETKVNTVMGVYVSWCRDGRSSLRVSDVFWRYDIGEAWRVHYVHRAVCFFADRYIRDASRRAYQMQQQEQEQEQEQRTNTTSAVMRMTMMPTAHEVLRVRRAFYRVQLYSDLFRSLDLACQAEPTSSSSSPGTQNKTDRSHQTEGFVRRFSALEVEQMVSVCEFLFRDIRDAFVDVANHDCWWALQGVVAVDMWPREHWQNEWLRSFVAEGLPFLQKAAQAQTFDERSAILSPKLGYRSVHLLDRLDWDNNDRIRGGDPPDRNEITLLSADPNPGPVEAYNLFHHHNSPFLPTPLLPLSLPLDRREFTPHRRAGYLFWDKQRIQTDLHGFRGPGWSIFSGEGGTQHRQITPEEWRQLVDARSSMFHRRELYLRGARGWWAADDESRLDWSGADYYSDGHPREREDDGEDQDEEEGEEACREAKIPSGLEMFAVMPIFQYEPVRRVDYRRGGGCI